MPATAHQHDKAFLKALHAATARMPTFLATDAWRCCLLAASAGIGCSSSVGSAALMMVVGARAVSNGFWQIWPLEVG